MINNHIRRLTIILCGIIELVFVLDKDKKKHLQLSSIVIFF